MTTEKSEELKILPEIAKDLHLRMVKTRIFEERVRKALFNNEILAPCHLCLGEEAVAAGVCVNLNQNDYIFSKGLHDVPHTKAGSEPGVGILYGISEITKGTDRETVFSKADLIVEKK